jgi:hypothetical protein
MPIHDKLIKALDHLMIQITSDLNNLSILEPQIKDINTYSLKPRVREHVGIIASDSSRVYRELRAAVLFAVQALAVKHIPSGEQVFIDAEAGYCSIPVGGGKTPVEEVVRRVAQFTSRELELSTAVSLMREGDLALFDGSIFSFLWYGKLPEIPGEFKFAVRPRPHTLRDLWRSVASKLLEAKRRTQLLFIAKTIRRNYYVNKLLSTQSDIVSSALNDLVVLDLLRKRGSLPKSPHFIEPIYIEKSEDLPRPLKSLDPEDMEYVKPLLPVTVTYVVFSYNSPPYQLTIPGKLSPEELSEVLGILLPHSITGYPDPLRVAHNMCKLTIQEFKAILAKLGLTRLLTGRELLGEFM